MLSVSVITFAFRLFAKTKAFKVRMEYLESLIPIMTSFSQCVSSAQKAHWRCWYF